MMTSYYERLEEAIRIYERRVDQVRRKLRREFIFDILFLIIMPILFGIGAYIWVGIGGLVTTLGLGGANAAEKLSRGETVLRRTYISERHSLKMSVLKLKSELTLCDPNDVACLKEVEQLIRKYYLVGRRP